jgi:hypothetical protein
MTNGGNKRLRIGVHLNDGSVTPGDDDVRNTTITTTATITTTTSTTAVKTATSTRATSTRSTRSTGKKTGGAHSVSKIPSLPLPREPMWEGAGIAYAASVGCAPLHDAESFSFAQQPSGSSRQQWTAYCVVAQPAVEDSYTYRMRELQESGSIYVPFCTSHHSPSSPLCRGCLLTHSPTHPHSRAPSLSHTLTHSITLTHTLTHSLYHTLAGFQPRFFALSSLFLLVPPLQSHPMHDIDCIVHYRACPVSLCALHWQCPAVR